MSNGMIAKLVWDGGDEVRIPEEMGQPRKDQMQGTACERLGEVSGRICYDSLGKGRPSFSYEEVTGADPHTGEQLLKPIEGYHEHILGVNHGSVNEHFHFTLEIPFDSDLLGDNRKMLVAWQCMNRPGVLVLPCQEPTGLRITLNPRAVREWYVWTKSFYGKVEDQFELDYQLQIMLQQAGYPLAPHIIPLPILSGPTLAGMWPELMDIRVVQPVSEHEKWISLYMSGSRGFSHEQVRHGDFTAISQRSTRFVDESGGAWVEHPLITAWKKDCPAIDLKKSFLGVDLGYMLNTEDGARSKYNLATEPVAKAQYDKCVATLEPWLIARGLDKTSARKQARGAARGYLGNALGTELIFSASVAQWKTMLGQRASQFADAEIREVYAAEKACVLSALKESRYANCFEGYELAPSPDGIGMVAKKA